MFLSSEVRNLSNISVMLKIHEDTLSEDIICKQMHMLSSKYGFGQSMDCLGQSMDPYFERAIHGLSKHKMTHRGGIGAGNECPFLMGTMQMF